MRKNEGVRALALWSQARLTEKREALDHHSHSRHKSAI